MAYGKVGGWVFDALRAVIPGIPAALTRSPSVLDDKRTCGGPVGPARAQGDLTT